MIKRITNLIANISIKQQLIQTSLIHFVTIEILIVYRKTVLHTLFFNKTIKIYQKKVVSTVFRNMR